MTAPAAQPAGSGAPRVAVVTGAARGIGAATVRALAGAGWRVVATDRCADDPRIGYPLGTEAQLRELASEYPDAVLALRADVQDPAALRRAVSVAEREFGGLDAAVAAAAVMAGGRALWEEDPGEGSVTGQESPGRESLDREPPGQEPPGQESPGAEPSGEGPSAGAPDPAEPAQPHGGGAEGPGAEWEALFSVGVSGVANLARAAVPALLRRPPPRSGRFVALASAAAHTGLWHLAGYTAAKHAVAGLIKGLAHDLRGTGITATGVSPGSTRTDMLAATAGLYGLDSPEAFAEHHLTERLLEPAEVAAAVAWLCSAESSALTGTVLRADAGLTA